MSLRGPHAGVVVDRGRCIGAGQCVLSAPALFDQDDDGRVVLRPDAEADRAAVRAAVDVCPSGALSPAVAQGGV